MRVSRRAAITRLGSAGAGLALAPAIIRGQPGPIVVAGQAVEIIVASISSATIRLTVAPLSGGGAVLPDDGALARGAHGPAVGRRRDPFSAIDSGELKVRYTADPPALHIEAQKGGEIQRLRFDGATSTLAFALGQGPLLGFGEGGPQFDRESRVFALARAQRRARRRGERESAGRTDHLPATSTLRA